ncbi:MAG: prolyl oligopeptidase family serine peptidase, partial [Rubrivivax sp.]
GDSQQARRDGVHDLHRHHRGGGGRDRRVPPQHGERLRDAMQKAGLQPEVLVYEDEAHGWRKPANQVDFARRLEVFLAKHLNEAKKP